MQMKPMSMANSFLQKNFANVPKPKGWFGVLILLHEFGQNSLIFIIILNQGNLGMCLLWLLENVNNIAVFSPILQTKVISNMNFGGKRHYISTEHLKSEKVEMGSKKKLMGENLKVVWAKLSTLSKAVFVTNVFA